MLPYNDVYVLKARELYDDFYAVVGVHSSRHMAEMHKELWLQKYEGIAYITSYKLNSMEV